MHFVLASTLQEYLSVRDTIGMIHSLIAMKRAPTDKDSLGHDINSWAKYLRTSMTQLSLFSLRIYL